MNSDSIPIDLITEICSRLPAKSIARFRCVSKLWSSILRRPYFTELFLTRSSAKPRILFAIEGDGWWSLFSLPQTLMSPYDESSSSLVVTAKYHMDFHQDPNMWIHPSSDRHFSCGYASGLIYFYSMCIKLKDDYVEVPSICNPNTGQYAILPSLERGVEGFEKPFSFFGFDPIDKQYKVLKPHQGCGGYHRIVTLGNGKEVWKPYDQGCCCDHKIVTLGTGKMRWRTIKCPLPHDPVSEGICINGVLYYLGDYQNYARSDVVDYESLDYVLVCFDVRSEKFKFIYGLQSLCKLINYKGKLCVIYWEDNHVGWKDHVDAIELYMWILEDAEKQEWSKYAYTLWDDKFFVDDNKYAPVVVVGVTSMGEIILSMGYYTSDQPFYVFYFNPKKNTIQSVEIRGLEECDHNNHFRSKVYTFVDHVEDLNVNDSKLLNLSIYAPYVKTKEEEKDEEEEEHDKDEGKGEPRRRRWRAW
ncbi:F-box domain [Arabidopsis thaliana x Arabidopsis arenosa]|uniref:F-box domain n=1 Tax=Arabidopsis thaliana x Arabidopsis arenosa TaxID=1240361 RepID=A0A8T1YB21_9BRAS|nr:F-box domain [Arabidopsis thaliana x Arabidopsis arenosa]